MSMSFPNGIQNVSADCGSFKIWAVKDAGFCFGVERAVKLAQEAAARFGKVYSLGPLIHNNEVVAMLASEGIHVAKTLDEVKQEAVISRSHGLPPETAQAAKRKGIKIIDVTCPFVKKAQDYASLLRKKGYHILIVGNADHPEVRALLGFSGPDAQVVSGPAQISLPAKISRVGVIAQTTERMEVLSATVGAVIAQSAEVRVFNTLCDSVLSRRENTSALAELCDIVIVVGGKHSANTNQLAAVSRQCGTETHHIERPEEINPRWFEGKTNAGVTVGASTPMWITSAVIESLRKISAHSHAVAQSCPTAKTDAP